MTKFFKRKRSKKGFTLVETLASIMILALVFAGILNAVAFSRQMVFTDNLRDKASEKGQLISDEIIAIATGYDPLDSSSVPAIKNEVASVTNEVSDPQTSVIGKVTYVGDDSTDFTAPDAFVEGTSPEIQYILTPVVPTSPVIENTDSDVMSYREVYQAGWDITVRVYYKRVKSESAFDCVEFSAFAPHYYLGN